MSIPIDFVGLNTRIKKKKGLDKNTITSIETIPSITVDGDVGTKIKPITDQRVESFKA